MRYDKRDCRVVSRLREFFSFIGIRTGSRHRIKYLLPGTGSFCPEPWRLNSVSFSLYLYTFSTKTYRTFRNGYGDYGGKIIPRLGKRREKGKCWERKLLCKRPPKSIEADFDVSIDSSPSDSFITAGRPNIVGRVFYPDSMVRVRATYQVVNFNLSLSDQIWIET